MNRKIFGIFSTLAIIFVLGLTGCSRTVEDVARWKTNGKSEKLVRALDDLKSEIRLAAAEALGELKAETAVDPLAALFDDPEADVVLASANALVSIGNAPAASHLMLALRLDNADVRLIAATGLGTLKSTNAVSELALVLDDSAAEVALAAATSLGQIGAEEASEALAAKLKAPSVKLRLTCVQSLAKTGGKAAAKGLTEALTDSDIHQTSVESLIAIGDASVPYALDALKSSSKPIRVGAIAVLKGLKAIPLTGIDAVWYQLAKLPTDTINAATIQKLAKEKNLPTLLEACAHSESTFRGNAFRAIEAIGESCTAPALNAANQTAWFKNRSAWHGAPAWQIDLWAALESLNPEFALNDSVAQTLRAQGRAAFRIIASPKFKPTRAYIPLLIGLLGDQTAPAPEQPKFDKDGIPIVKQTRDTFRGEANQQTAKDKLIAAGDRAVLPLIAASTGANELVAGHAAEILGKIGDARAVKPLLGVLSQKIETGEVLTDSPFYNALQQLDDPAAEPVLLKVRPNADRAMRIFARKYGIKVLSAENREAATDAPLPVTFRLGYIAGPRLIETPVTFAKDSNGDWTPTPALPDQLPQ